MRKLLIRLYVNYICWSVDLSVRNNREWNRREEMSRVRWACALHEVNNEQDR